MRARSRLLRGFVVGALAALLTVAGWLAWTLDTDRLAARLIREGEVRAAERFLRPVHAPPELPGSFGHRAAEAWDALTALERSSRDVELCRAARAGEAPLPPEDAACRRELAQAEVALEALLEGTHAREASPIDGLGALDLPAAGRGWAVGAYAAKLAALRIRVQLSAGEAPAALRTCTDLLALARDLGWGTALEGRLAAETVAEVAFRPCAAAVEAAPEPALQAFVDAAGAIEAGTPSFDTCLREWALVSMLQGFAPYLGPGIARLPPVVQIWARENAPDHPLAVVEKLALGDFWHRLQARMDRVVDAAKLPGEASVERLQALVRPPTSAWNPLARRALPELSRVAMTDLRVRAEMELLRGSASVAAEHARTGRWPELASAPGRPPIRIEARDGGEVAVTLDAPRGGLSLSLGGVPPGSAAAPDAGADRP